MFGRTPEYSTIFVVFGIAVPLGTVPTQSLGNTQLANENAVLINDMQTGCYYGARNSVVFLDTTYRQKSSDYGAALAICSSEMSCNLTPVADVFHLDCQDLWKGDLGASNAPCAANFRVLACQ